MIPEIFGKYQVIRLLGHGGMANVYEARDTLLDRRVAVKTIHPHLVDDSKLLQRFQHEAKLLASLRHPHIVRFYDFDIFNGQPFMVMEYLEGGTLAKKLTEARSQQKRLPEGEVLQILEAIAAALDYAHAHGAIHRDIKPANILFTRENAPVVTDFGITKILSESLHISLTGSVIGTPAYMAPEQASGAAIDQRTDIYALGVMLYEMATGRTPFQGNSPTDIIIKQLTVSPPAPRQYNPTLPNIAQAVILKALAKDPARRYDRAGEFARTFRAALESEPESRDLLKIESEAPTIIEALPVVAQSSLQFWHPQDQPPDSEPLSEPLDTNNLKVSGQYTEVEPPPFGETSSHDGIPVPPEIFPVSVPIQVPQPPVYPSEHEAILPPSSGLALAPDVLPGHLWIQALDVNLSFPRGKQEIIIGREDPFSDLFPDIDLEPYGGQDAGVSRRHVRISLSRGQVMIEDLNTMNGTLLNKQRLNPGQIEPLNNGDEISLGKIVLIYYVQ